MADSTRWVESARYSRKREVTHDLSGFVREASFEGDLEPFVPYLKLGQERGVRQRLVPDHSGGLTITTSAKRDISRKAAKGAKKNYEYWLGAHDWKDWNCLNG